MKSTLFCLTFLASFACQAASQEVNLYSARKEALIKPLLDAFTEQSGIKVNIISSKADALLKRIESEGINSPADVLLSTDAGRLHRAKLAGVFASTESIILTESIPANLRDPDGQWYGLSIRARPILVSDVALKEKITRYEDLAKAEFKGQICIRSSGNIYNQSLVASMLNPLGEQAVEMWAMGLVANFARKPQGGDRDQIRAAAAGQCKIAVANTYYLANMLSNQGNASDYSAAQKMTVIWPNQADRGAHINVSGAGVLKHAPNPDNALTLIEFLASDKAQEIYANVNFEYPVNKDVKQHSLLSAWGDFKAHQISLEQLGVNNPRAVRLMDRAGWK